MRKDDLAPGELLEKLQTKTSHGRFGDDHVVGEDLLLQVSGLDLCQDVLVGNGLHVHIDLLVGYCCYCYYLY